MLSKVQCVCSCCTANLKYMYLVTNSTKQKYCNTFNIDFVKETISEDYDRHPAWYKIKLILNLLEKYTTIMYIDTDDGFVNYADNINDYLTDKFDVALCETDERFEYWSVHCQ